jgi:hypothetical protein
MTDAEGRYGPNTPALERLLSDARVLGPSGIERIAWGWSRYASGGLDQCRRAEESGRRAVGETGRQGAWGAAEQDLKALVLPWLLPNEVPDRYRD